MHPAATRPRAAWLEAGPHSSTRKALLCCLLLVGLFLWSGDRLIARHVDRVAAEKGQARLDLLSTAVEGVAQSVSRTLEWVDALQGLTAAAWLKAQAQDATLDEVVTGFLRNIADDRPIPIFQVAVIGRDGMLAWSTVEHAAPLDLSDREHFWVHRDGYRGPFSSAPLIGRASSRSSIQFTRAIIDGKDAFAGVVVVSVDPLDITRDLAAALSVRSAVATLLRQDGTILARTSDPLVHIGRRLPEQAIAEMFDVLVGAFRRNSPVTEQSAFYAWRRLEAQSLAVVVGEPTAVADAQVQALRTALNARLVAGLILMVAATLLAGSMLDRRRATAMADAAETTRRGMENLVEALPGVVYRATVDPGGEFRSSYVSRAIRRVAGLEPESFVEERRLQISGEPPPGELATLMRDLRTSGEYVIEYRVPAAHDSWRWLRERGRMVRPLPEGLVEIVGMISDITEERHVKAQAISASKLATLGEMATGVAHELNQPCAAIVIAADAAKIELLRITPSSVHSVSARLDVIADQAMRLRQTIDHFRIFGRSNDDADELIPVGEALAGALTITGGTLHAAGIRVQAPGPIALPSVRGPRVAFEHVLVNLLVNARDAMREAPMAARSIDVAARHDPKAAEVIITIADRGTGLAPAVLERVFEPFYTTKPVGEGTGIGLSVAYGTIRTMGGHIDLANRPGGGAVATLRLPVAKPHQPQAGRTEMATT